MAIWSKSNQSDLHWYSASLLKDGTYMVKGDVKNHMYSSGKYAIHVYATDGNNIKKLVGSNVCQMNYEKKFVPQEWLFIGDSYFDAIDTAVEMGYHNNFNDNKGTPDLGGVPLYGMWGRTTAMMAEDIKNGTIPINDSIKNVVLYLGTNNVGWAGGTAYAAQTEMRELIALIHEKRPDALIYILALYNVENGINELNEYYKVIDSELSFVRYIDTRSGLIREDGSLKSGYANGIHIAPSYYPVWVTKMIDKLNMK